MALESALRRLVVQPATMCRRCRRSFATSTWHRQQQQSATAEFAALLEASRNSSSSPPRSQPIASDFARSSARQSGPGGKGALASSLISEMAAAQRLQRERAGVEEHRNWDRKDLERQVFRKWKAGDVYAPHDLTGIEAAKWKKLRRKGSQKYDVVDQLGINPIQHYKNFSMMSEFMSDMGRIKHRDETGLRPVNQRRMAKAMRRAIGTGLMPGVYRHPEILKMEVKNKRPI